MLREIPNPEGVGAAPAHEGGWLSKAAAPAIRPTRRGGLVPGGVGRQPLADGIAAARDAGEHVVVPLDVKRYAARYRRCDDRAAPVPELDAPTREIGKILTRIIDEHLAQDRPGPCTHGVHAAGRGPDRAAGGVHGGAERRVGALVEVVRDAIMIGVEEWRREGAETLLGMHPPPVRARLVTPTRVGKGGVRALGPAPPGR